MPEHTPDCDWPADHMGACPDREPPYKPSTYAPVACPVWCPQNPEVPHADRERCTGEHRYPGDHRSASQIEWAARVALAAPLSDDPAQGQESM